MNILFLMTDQLRTDCVGYTPGSKLRTPNLDRIAEGCAFLRCQTVNPVCQPARSALLTGKYSHQLNCLQMAGDLSFDHPTWPQAMQQAGYWTAGIGKFHFLQTWPWETPRGQGLDLVALKPSMEALGFDRVWESSGKQLALKNHCDYAAYLESHDLLEAFRDFIEARGTNHARPTGELAKDGDAWPFAEEHHVDIVTGREIRRAIEERPADQPFCIYGSFCSPHKPFDPPQRFLDQVPCEEVDDFLPGDQPLTDADKTNLWKLRRAYKATVLLIDEQVGAILDLLEARGELANTVILVSSDHGELMGDHALVQKSNYYQESQGIPLAIRHPQHLSGARFDSPVELTDLAATILDVAGIDPQTALSRPWPAFNNIVPCRSLLPMIAGEAGAVREFAFSEYANQWSSITSQDYKYVMLHHYDDPDAPAELLFHTATDPGEQRNLVDDPDRASVLQWHRNRLTWIRNQTPAAQHVWAPLSTFTPPT